MDYFAALPTVLPLYLQMGHKPKLAPPAFHTDKLTPSAGLIVDESQGVSMSIISWPDEAILSPFFYPENQGLERLSGLQVSCGVRCKPRTSKPKSSGLSMTVQLSLES